MKKLLILLFSIFFLFSGTKVFAAQGVDCQNIKFPNLSTLGFKLKNETNWNIIKDGMSFNVEKDSSFKVKVFKTVNYSCSYFD